MDCQGHASTYAVLARAGWLRAAYVKAAIRATCIYAALVF